MKWTESEENLNRFFDHANNVHPTIKFTHETSRNNISFLCYHLMESMRKSSILSWLLFLLVSSSRIRTYSLLYWPNVYIPHCGGPFFFLWVWVLYRFQQYFDSVIWYIYQ
jgi:hypothetical protein